MASNRRRTPLVGAAELQIAARAEPAAIVPLAATLIAAETLGVQLSNLKNSSVNPVWSTFQRISPSLVVETGALEVRKLQRHESVNH